MNDTTRPDSSDAERPVSNREAAASETARGSISPTFHYVIVRRELSGGALLAQVSHAAGESAAHHALRTGAPLPGDARVVVLVATKEQMGAAIDLLRPEAAGSISVIEETDGPLAGSVTALGFLTSDREKFKPLIGHLRPWRSP